MIYLVYLFCQLIQIPRAKVQTPAFAYSEDKRPVEVASVQPKLSTRRYDIYHTCTEGINRFITSRAVCHKCIDLQWGDMLYIIYILDFRK